MDKFRQPEKNLLIFEKVLRIVQFFVLRVKSRAASIKTSQQEELRPAAGEAAREVEFIENCLEILVRMKLNGQLQEKGDFMNLV